MDRAGWYSFLQRWSTKLLESGLYPSDLLQSFIASSWLGFPGASDEQIVQAETRLGVTLPPSYRTFLGVSNGWHIADLLTERLWSAEEIEWFATRHQDWIDAWAEAGQLAATQYGEQSPVSDESYLIYGKDQNTNATFRQEYLQTALEISTNSPDSSAIYLLNPRIVDSDGEWEAWFFADWLPGAYRYRSFESLMVSLYDDVDRRIANEQPQP